MKSHDFTLKDKDGNSHTLSEYTGKWLVLYFYPKDDTPGCTIEACSFRDNFSEFASRNIAVVGVSLDSEKSHQKFIEKHNLNFTLLSDPDGILIRKYDSLGEKSLFGKKLRYVKRNTILISPSGEVFKEYKNVDPNTHVKQIMEDIKKSTT